MRVPAMHGGGGGGSSGSGSGSGVSSALSSLMVGAGTTVAGSAAMVKFASLTSVAPTTPPTMSTSTRILAAVVAVDGTVQRYAPSLISLSAMIAGNVMPPSVDSESR